MKMIYSVFVSVAVLFLGCSMDMGSEHEVVVSVESSRYHCHECGYEWFGSTVTTLMCPVCESYRIEILED